MNYREALSEMFLTCKGWDSESQSLKEAFDKGIDFQKKQGGSRE